MSGSPFPSLGAEAHVPLSARLWSVRTRNSADAHRTSTAERRKGRTSQASSVPPASDLCVAGSALPRVARARVPLMALTVLLAFLYVPLIKRGRRLCGNAGLFMSRLWNNTK